MFFGYGSVKPKKGGQTKACGIYPFLKVMTTFEQVNYTGNYWMSKKPGPFSYEGTIYKNG